MRIQRLKDKNEKFEYNCYFRRLMPWKEVADSDWGSGIARIEPYNATTPHKHNQGEVFIILEGSAIIHIEDKSEYVSAGDMVYIEPNKIHSLENIKKDKTLVMLCIWWHEKGGKND